MQHNAVPAASASASATPAPSSAFARTARPAVGEGKDDAHDAHFEEKLFLHISDNHDAVGVLAYMGSPPTVALRQQPAWPLVQKQYHVHTPSQPQPQP